MNKITNTTLDVDRGTRTRLATLARASRMTTIEEDTASIEGVEMQRQELELDMPGRATVRVHETIAPGVVLASARPPSSAAYLALLVLAETWGQPSTIYEDELADTEYADVTAVWLRPEIESGEAIVQHLLGHGDRGYEWSPIETATWLDRARPALEGDA